MHKQTKVLKLSGFTIVELLIVIVVIAILAAISIVAYNGIQQRANDTVRMSDADTIQKSLSLYFAERGTFPVEQPNPGNSTWEISTDLGFLTSLNSYTGNKVFKAPNGSRYWYHTFGAGNYSCPASLGSYYVLWITGMQAQSGGAKMQTNGCTGQTLFSASEVNNSANYMYFGFN